MKQVFVCVVVKREYYRVTIPLKRKPPLDEASFMTSLDHYIKKKGLNFSCN